MKKLLLILACTPLAIFGMKKQEPVQDVVKFITMEHKHMQDWLDYKKAKNDAKIELMKKHLAEMVALKTKDLPEFGKGTDVQAYMGAKLKAWIKMHEQQNKEWKNFYESWHMKGSDLGAAHKKELDSFKDMLKPMIVD